MRTIHLFVMAVFIAIAVYVGGCSDTPINNSSTQQNQQQTDATCTDGVTCDLTAGQYTDVGSLTVSNDQNNLYVTYTCTGSCTFGTLHLWVGTDLGDMPAVQNGPNAGTPIPGQFPYSHNATGLTTYTFTIPWSDLNVADVNDICLTNLYVVPHSEVTCGGVTNTAFGGCNPVNVTSPGRWWFYQVYSVCCDNGTPNPPECNTAFGKGGWVWTTSSQSNPENLPSLNLMRNRWGWAINLTQTGTTTYQIWAGAGLNNTANGTLVGTLTVNWDGFNAIVTYNITSTGCKFTELHLYAEDERPGPRIAPGQFGNTQTFNPGVTTYTFNVPLENTNGVDGVWLIAHSVVCCN